MTAEDRNVKENEGKVLREQLKFPILKTHLKRRKGKLTNQLFFQAVSHFVSLVGMISAPLGMITMSLHNSQSGVI